MPSLTIVLVIFLSGFVLHRHTTVKIGVAAALLLGLMLTGSWTSDVVHTLDRVFTSLT